MKEKTIITTVEITNVFKNVPDCFELDKTAYGNVIKDKLSEAINSDGVVVANVQEFELDSCHEKINVPPYGGEYEQGFADGFNKAIDEMKG